MLFYQAKICIRANKAILNHNDSNERKKDRRQKLAK